MLMDIYALAPERCAAAVERFLDRFLPHRDRADSDYSVRLTKDKPARIFATADEMTAFCESQAGADARAYWVNRRAGDPHSAHVFFLSDGGLVLGLSVAALDEAAWNQWLDELRAFTGAEYGYWTGECPPEDRIVEFVAVAKKARWGAGSSPHAASGR